MSLCCCEAPHGATLQQQVQQLQVVLQQGPLALLLLPLMGLVLQGAKTAGVAAVLGLARSSHQVRGLMKL
jgi:hypothetical protein